MKNLILKSYISNKLNCEEHNVIPENSGADLQIRQTERQFGNLLKT